VTEILEVDMAFIWLVTDPSPAPISNIFVYCDCVIPALSNSFCNWFKEKTKVAPRPSNL
jgi:hypothetical protein